MRKIIRNKLGPIPDDHFENEPTFPAKNVSPRSQFLKDHIAALNADKETGDGDGEPRKLSKPEKESR
jgi:hypothetical protein